MRSTPTFQLERIILEVSFFLCGLALASHDFVFHKHSSLNISMKTRNSIDPKTPQMKMIYGDLQCTFLFN